MSDTERYAPAVPEGDTLRRLADKIDHRLAGARVERSVMRDPRLSGVDLTGTVLESADAYGKHLFVRFDDGRTLHAHLLMTGGFEVGPPSRESTWRRRVELWLDAGRLTGVAVPILGMVPTGAEHEITDPLGPDLCARSGPPDVDEIVGRMLRSPDVPVAGSLLDQRNVAGLGNLYVNDVPFIAAIDPHQPVGSIDGLEDLVAIATALIRTNAERGPQNTTGRRLHTDAGWVHGLGRRPCPVCGERLAYENDDRTPWRRSVTWCPKCQAAGDRSRVDLRRVRRLIGLHPAVKLAVFPPAPA